MLGRLKTLLTYLYDPIVICDMNNKIIYLNPAAEKNFKKGKTSMEGKDIRDLFSKNSMDKILLGLGDIRKSGEAIHLNIEEGSKYFKTGISPIVNDQEEWVGFILNFLDISRDVNSGKNQAQFISLIINELREPAVSVNRILNELKSEWGNKNGDNFNTLVDKGILDSGQIIKRVDGIAGLSPLLGKQIEGEMEELDIIEIIKYSIEGIISFALKKKIGIESSFYSNIPMIRGNREALNRAIIGILIFSVTQLPPCGIISIFGKAILELDNKKYIIISIADNGGGLSNKDVELLLDKDGFTKYKNDVGEDITRIEGGLFLAKDIVEAHKGKFSVVNESGIGTAFSLLFEGI